MKKIYLLLILSMAYNVIANPQFTIDESHQILVSEYTGKIRTLNEQVVAAKAEGFVEQIPNIGDKVLNNQSLYKQENKLLKSELIQKNKLIAAQEAVEKLYQKQYERMKSLNERQLGAQNDIERMEVDLINAQLALTQLRSEQIILEQKVNSLSSISSVTGTVIQRYVQPGQYVSRGESLYQLVDMDRWILEIPVRASLTRALPIGTPIKIKLDTTSDWIDMRVIGVETQTVSNTLVNIRLLSNETLQKGLLFDGLQVFGSYKIELRNMYVLPASSIVKRQDGHYVRLGQDESSQEGQQMTKIKVVSEIGHRKIVQGDTLRLNSKLFTFPTLGE
ncbi:efflux RND transporter periplasmic adaptor subunit [Pseudoalteromonas luteoviolacea]|uniref:Uncharacterized protein n=1 Tax=Pseudoalteromonas luteoviolacea NCIMB 1942 TaxID=1365253 RepID=A0A167CLG6_9GAMM|nr:efflux RND transporter periplasmic adaptor subunit [Pseudoalteromonas luteoviolacea]KZN47804.1 hypothetical protein N482_08815 [Pseudoalteromonas luteoviolacea NCIMB 1942]